MRAETKTIKNAGGVFICILCLGFLPVLFTSCGEGEEGNSAVEVSLNFTPMQVDLLPAEELMDEALEIFWNFLEGRDTFPSIITEIVFEVTYPELETGPIRKVLTGEDISATPRVRFDLPSGPNRTFRVEAINRGGEIMFSGARTIELEPSSAIVPLNLNLEFHCFGTVWDPEGDSFMRLYEDLEPLAGPLGEILGVDLGSVNPDLLVDFDVLTLSVESRPAEVVVTAEFLDNISQANLFAAVLLDTDLDPATPVDTILYELAHLIDGLGAEYLLFIVEGGALFVDISTYVGSVSDLLQSGQAVPLSFDREVVEVSIPASLIPGYVGGQVGFFGYFGDDGIPLDLASNWGACPTPP